MRGVGVGLRTLAGLSAVWILLAGAGPLRAQEELVAQGNQRYQEGDYAAAVDAYEAVLDAGYASADLYYNLGNAYFKSGELGRSILAWERARDLRPHDPDIAANLELARSLTVDEIEPLPRFWLFSAWSWWLHLVPRSFLVAVVGLAWLLLAVGLGVRILAAGGRTRRTGGWLAVGSAVVVLVLGLNLAVRELGIGQPDRAVILADAVPVRSAPTDDDDLTLFEVHEGTLVRIDRRTDSWAEIVLEDGKVGWVPAEAMGIV